MCTYLCVCMCVDVCMSVYMYVYRYRFVCVIFCPWLCMLACACTCLSYVEGIRLSNQTGDTTGQGQCPLVVHVLFAHSLHIQHFECKKIFKTLQIFVPWHLRVRLSKRVFMYTSLWAPLLSPTLTIWMIFSKKQRTHWFTRNSIIQVNLELPLTRLSMATSSYISPTVHTLMHAYTRRNHAIESRVFPSPVYENQLIYFTLAFFFLLSHFHT